MITPPGSPDDGQQAASEATDPQPATEADTVVDETMLDSSGEEEEVESALSDPPVETGPLLPTDDWSPSNSLAWRVWLQRTMAVIIGMVLAILLFGFLAGRLTRSDRTATPETPAESVAESATAALKPTSDSPAANGEPTATDLGVAEAKRAPADPTDLPRPVGEDTVDGEDAADAKESDPVERRRGVPTPAVRPRDDTETPPPAPSPPTPVTITPSESAAGGEEEESPPGLIAETPDPERTRMEAGPRLSDMLREVDALLADRAAAAEPDSEIERDDSAEEVLDAVEMVVPRPAPLSVDVTARLQDTLPAVDCDMVPLIEFVRFATDFSTIPISFHAESLNWLQLSLETPVTLHEQDRSIGELLAMVLGPLGLTFEAVDEQLVIRRNAKVAAGELREVRFDVADLAGGEPQKLDQLQAAILQLVLPSSWSENGGPGTLTRDEQVLVVQQEEAALFEVLFLLEKTRVATGLAPRSGFPAELFDPLGRIAHQLENQAQPVTLTFLREVPLTELVRRIEERAKIRVLINWQALAKEGWNPNLKLGFTVHEEPWGPALGELLAPLGLVLRSVNGDVVEITTQAAANEHLQVECYPLEVVESTKLASGSEGGVDGERLRTHLGEHGFREKEAGGRLVLDQTFRLLWLRAPHRVHHGFAQFLSTE